MAKAKKKGKVPVPRQAHKPKGWTRLEAVDGIVTYRLDSWAKFFEVIETEIFAAAENAQKFIWRGQRRLDWPLSTTLDRLFDRLKLPGNSSEVEEQSRKHLETFKYATRGRRGSHPVILSENEWWALGQHFGLATPLLDWTHSPFAAAYFAFEERASDPSEYRVVYGLEMNAISQKNHELLNGPSFETGRPLVLEFIDPLSDENQRLVSQNGIFTRSPIGFPVEQWISQAFEHSAETILLRIEIPNQHRIECLRTLNRMNINHLSLFPDLGGASRSANLRLELEQHK